MPAGFWFDARAGNDDSFLSFMIVYKREGTRVSHPRMRKSNYTNILFLLLLSEIAIMADVQGAASSSIGSLNQNARYFLVFLVCFLTQLL